MDVDPRRSNGMECPQTVVNLDPGFGAPEPFRLLEDYPPSTSIWIRLGFTFYTESTDPDYRLVQAAVPSWFAVLVCVVVTAVPTSRLLKARGRNARQMRGLCPACGYDLRGAAHER